MALDLDGREVKVRTPVCGAIQPQRWKNDDTTYIVQYVLIYPSRIVLRR